MSDVAWESAGSGNCFICHGTGMKDGTGWNCVYCNGTGKELERVRRNEALAQQHEDTKANGEPRDS